MRAAEQVYRATHDAHMIHGWSLVFRLWASYVTILSKRFSGDAKSRFLPMYEGFFRQELDKLIPYEPGKPIREVQEEFGLTEIVKLASNESPLPPFPAALAAIAGAAGDLNRYPDGGAVELKRALAAKYTVAIDNIAIGNGSNELELLLASACLDPEDNVIYPSPSFVVYPTLADIMGAQGIAVPLKNHRHDVEAMAALVTRNTKLLILCTPNNPTGNIITKKEADWLMNNVPEHVLVVFDEAYIEFADDPDCPDGLEYFKAGRNVMVMRTFSKIFGLAGLRIGYGIAAPEVISALNKVRAPFNVNSLAQAAALASLNETTELLARKQANLAEKEFMYAELDRLGLSYIPSQANFILVDTGRGSRTVFMDLLRRGVIVRSGDALGYESWIRVTIGTRAENQKFFAELENILV